MPGRQPRVPSADVELDTPYQDREVRQRPKKHDEKPASNQGDYLDRIIDLSF